MGVYEALDPRNELQMSVLNARMVVAEAELAKLAESLTQLDAAEKHVQTGGVPDWADLPLISRTAEQLGLACSNSLGQQQLVEECCSRPSDAVDFLLEQAISFSAAERGNNKDSDSKLGELSCFPHEIEYGLLAVECALRPSMTADPGPPADSPRLMVNRLHAVIDNPQQFGAGTHDLGYLNFMAWYAELVGWEYGVIADYQGGWTTQSYGIEQGAGS
jgi:hypothetical protein